jgi:hypothetical protein
MMMMAMTMRMLRTWTRTWWSLMLRRDPAPLPDLDQVVLVVQQALRMGVTPRSVRVHPHHRGQV